MGSATASSMRFTESWRIAHGASDSKFQDESAGTGDGESGRLIDLKDYFNIALGEP
jgi:hypothetical protein